MADLTVLDLFCGTGGFSKGFENAGHFKVAFGIDLLAISMETFRQNHQGAVGLTGDIRTVSKTKVSKLTGLKQGEVDVVIGGPPCQGFSSIRPFRSGDEDDPRNSLFEQFASYVNYFRPRVFVLENVVGLATFKDGKTIETIQDCFTSLGYDSDWRILNAAHFGVPQKRERLILLGAQRGVPIRFPRPTHAGRFKTIGFKDASRMLRPDDGTLWADELPPALTVMDAVDDLPPVGAGQSAKSYTDPPRNEYQAARRTRATKLTWHGATAHTKRMLEIIRHSGPNIESIPKHLITSGFSSCYSRLDADEPAPTITVNFVHPASNKCIHPKQDRALTPREGARLQSFDDDFDFAGNRTQVAKQIGNAVPPLLGRAIAMTVLEMLGETSVNGYGRPRVGRRAHVNA